jgi:sorting nexin-8
LEDSLSPSLNDLFEKTRAGVRRSADAYINLCNLMDRLSKRTEGLAADHLRISLSLQSLTDASEDTYATDPNEVPLLNEGLNATAKHMSNSQSLLEDEARAWDQGVLEDLKRQRDALVSVRDMFDRRDRYDKDNIPALERRIQNNETKLIAIRSKPDGQIKPDEVEKVTKAIIAVCLMIPFFSMPLMNNRTRNPSLRSMLGEYSLKSAYGMSLFISSSRRFMSAD